MSGKILNPIKNLILIITVLISGAASLVAQNVNADNEQNNKETGEDLQQFMEDSRKEIDFYSLEELLNVEVEVASLFEEDELNVGSTVSSISSAQWKKQGARRLHEALDNEMSMIAYPLLAGAYATPIRGYAQTDCKGIEMLIDGVPLVELSTGNSVFYNQNWILGTLSRIEIIKGPGSAIYGSDAFHGVISMKSFESKKDHYEIEGAGAWPLYGDASVKISQGFGSMVRIDMAAGASYQGDQKLEYEYNDPIGGGIFIPEVTQKSGTAERKFKYNSESGVLKINVNPSDKISFKAGAYLNMGKYEDFIGPVYITLPLPPNFPKLYSQDNDVTDTENLFLMTNGSAVYTFPKKTSVEINGFYWIGERELTSPGGPTYIDVRYIREEDVSRTGVNIIVKQPDNALNLQWLIAYSYTAMDIGCYETLILNSGPIPGKQEGPGIVDGEYRNINSVFGQIKWGAIDKKLFVLLGIRDDVYSDFGNQITPRGGLIYMPTEKSSIKGLYGRAFRAPAATELKGSVSVVMGDPDLKPEIIDIFELIYMIKEKDWRFSINTFYSKWTNGIILEDVAIGNYNQKYTNKGESDSMGGEMEAFFSIDPFALDLGFSYVRSRALNVKDPDDPSKTIDMVYKTFPEYSINAGIYYTLRPVDINFYLNNIVHLNMKETNESTKPNPDSLPPYFRTDLNISKVIAEKLELYLNIRNLFNRENHVPSVVGAIDGYVEPGISVMLRAGYKI